IKLFFKKQNRITSTFYIVRLTLLENVVSLVVDIDLGNTQNEQRAQDQGYHQLDQGQTLLAIHGGRLPAHICVLKVKVHKVFPSSSALASRQPSPEASQARRTSRAAPSGSQTPGVLEIQARKWAPKVSAPG